MYSFRVLGKKRNFGNKQTGDFSLKTRLGQSSD